MTRNHFIHLRMTELLEHYSMEYTEHFAQAISERVTREADIVAKMAPFDESESAPYQKHIFVGSPGDKCTTCHNTLIHPNHYTGIRESQ